jgi:hypothetical protein
MSAYYFEYDAVNKIFAARFEDELTDEIFKEFYAAAPRYIESCDVRAGIVDLAGLKRFDVTTDAIRQVAALMPLLGDPIPRYVIAPPDHVFGMVRMFQMSGKSREMLRVVRSAEEAYAALGVKEPHFEKLS